MRPQTIGRALGIGVRVAGRIAGQRIGGPGVPARSSPAAASQPQAAAQPRVAVPSTGAVKRGVGGFFKPFRRVGSIVFLEVMGVFFLLFVLIFSQAMWRMRTSMHSGPDHIRFLVSAVLAVMFLYLGLSSFWRARRR